MYMKNIYFRKNIQQSSDGNKEKVSLGDCQLTQYQIPQTNIIRIELQTARRIIKKFLEVRWLN